MSKFGSCVCIVLIVLFCGMIGTAYYYHIEHINNIEERIGFLENKSCVNRGLAFRTARIVSSKICECELKIEECKYAISLLYDKVEEQEMKGVCSREEDEENSSRGLVR